MPPRRKAAGAAAAKKGKKDAKKEEATSADVEVADVAPAAVKQEEPEQQASSSSAAPAASTRSSGRTTRRGKKAVEEEVLETAAENVKTEAAEDGQKPDIKAEAEAEEQVIAEAQAAEGDKDKEAELATADPINEVPPPSVAAELEGRASVESATAAPASRGGAPDIIGVIEEREDEDYIPDDSEPAPNDAEELRRLAERPMNAVDTRSVPPSLAPRSQRAAGKQAETRASAARDEPSMESSASANGSVEPAELSDGAGSSLAARMAKMNALRKRMNDSFTANRKDVVAAQNEHRKAMAESKRLERKRQQAEAMGEKLEAMETGEDLERKKNWEYSLADNEAWNKKLAKKERRMDTGFSTFDEAARRKYRRDMDNFKPDLKAYNQQKAAALGIEYEEAEASRELLPHASSSTGSQVVPGSDNALYRDANSFVYADHKPSEDAIDRVVGKLNETINNRGKRSRARNEEEGDINYINDRNKVFNKKLDRYFNKVSCFLCCLPACN